MKAALTNKNKHETTSLENWAEGLSRQAFGKVSFVFLMKTLPFLMFLLICASDLNSCEAIRFCGMPSSVFSEQWHFFS